jgi:phage tail sheath protein FI
MADQPTYPGVYIQELPSGVRTITGVATSITAFVGRTLRGPVNVATTIFSYGDYDRQFGGLWLNSSVSFAVRDFFLNGGSTAVIVRLDNGALPVTITVPGAGTDTLELITANPGSWGFNLSVTVDYKTKDPTDTTLFNITITDSAGTVEKYVNASTDKGSSSYLPRLLGQNSQLVAVNTTSGGDFKMSTGRPNVTANPITPVLPPGSPPLSPPVSSISDFDGTFLNDASFFGTGMQDNKQGLFALENADLFNLLCIPPYTGASGTPATGEQATDVTTSLIAQADVYCQSRRAVFIVDPHSSWTTKAKALTQFEAGTYPGITSNYSALYFPRLLEANLLRNNQVEQFVPCGAVAGIIARTDAQRGVWKAPAGLDATFSGVPQLSVPLTDMENGDLNQEGVNCLRAMPVYGRLVWGARTLQGADRLASQWKYIPVRRTALYIEESLYRGTQWVVFEPNDEPLWAQIRLNIGAFMHSMFIQGAFQGSTPKDAYLVKCDSETTTQNDINLGIVNILVGFAPLKPAEFVIIQIQQLAGQIDT